MVCLLGCSPTPSAGDGAVDPSEGVRVEAETEAPEPVEGAKISASASPGFGVEREGDPELALILPEVRALEQAFGLPGFGQRALEGDDFELRLYYRLPERRLAIHLWSEAGALGGAAWVWWTTSGSEVDYVALEIDDWVDCPEPRTLGGTTGCRVRFAEDHDWGPSLAVLEQQPLWTQPDQRERPEPLTDEEVFEVLLVEQADSGRQRRWAWRDFELDPREEARTAEALRSAMWTVFEGAEWAYDEADEPIKDRRPAPPDPR